MSSVLSIGTTPLILVNMIFTGEGGSFDATEKRERQIIRDHLRANAVCVILYFAVCVVSSCLYLKIPKQYLCPS